MLGRSLLPSIMADKAYPRRSRFNLANLDSTPPVEVLSVGLASLTIVPSIDPSASSWTAGGMSGVAPISAIAWASRGQCSSLSGRGGVSVSSSLTDPVSRAPSPSFAVGVSDLWNRLLIQDAYQHPYAYQYALSDKAKVSLDSKRVSRQEVSSIALNSHKISYD